MIFFHVESELALLEMTGCRRDWGLSFQRSMETAVQAVDLNSDTGTNFFEKEKQEKRQ